MSASWRPSHSLAPAHARVGYLVNASLGARCRNRTIAVVAAMIADHGSTVISHVAPQFRAVTQEISRHYLLRVGVPMSDVFRVTGKAHQLLIRLRRSAMPQQVPDTLDRCLGRLQRTNLNIANREPA